MRNFNEADKKKKKARIQMPENPAGLTREKLAVLERIVKASLKGGYLPCAVAWKIAGEAGVPKIAVGAITDKLGVRVTDCQVGCFKVDKDLHEDMTGKKPDKKIVARLEALNKNDKLTCAGVFELAKELGIKPLAIADAANLRNLKIRRCQLGCF